MEKYYVSTITVEANGAEIPSIFGYDGYNAAMGAFHSEMAGKIAAGVKSAFCTVMTAAGVIVKQERWAEPEPAPTPEGE